MIRGASVQIQQTASTQGNIPLQTGVIFLHGASSSGKSTLARHVQAIAPMPLWHLSIDHFRDSAAWPMARYGAGEFDWCANRERLFDGFHAMLGAAARSGNDLIVEHILDSTDWLRTLQKEFADIPVLFVALHCPVATLATREQLRGDRPLGSAARDAATIHTGLTYDLELSGTDTPDKNARAILTALSGDRRGFMKS